jgi:radical SAM superfamily enzyme YgiQ (UPF0313 family)
LTDSELEQCTLNEEARMHNHIIDRYDGICYDGIYAKYTKLPINDEFISGARYTKELLRAIIPLNNSSKRPLAYVTQASMNLSRHNTLLGLLADANFGLIFVGIETPNKASLKEAGKCQNVRKNLSSDVEKTLSFGTRIRAGLVVGFDNDTPDLKMAVLPEEILRALKQELQMWSREDV